MNPIGWLLAVPVATATAVMAGRSVRLSERIQIAGAFGLAAAGSYAAWRVWQNGPLSGGYTGGQALFRLDALGAWNAFLIVWIGFCAALASVDTVRHEPGRRRKLYYAGLHLLLGCLLLTSVSDNLGVAWAALELSTVIATGLIAFKSDKKSLEAAWKYFLMGHVGMALALLGVIFLYLAAAGVVGENASALNWFTLFHAAELLHPGWMKLALVFALVGFGTKAGVAPFHFWLPDAHSQAPAPVSAVLSGITLNTAICTMLRVFALARGPLEPLSRELLLGFGLLSMAFAVPFLLVQRDLKRLWAYSSVEHTGVILFGAGVGNALGLAGSTLHMFNHAMLKTLLFLVSGLIVSRYRTGSLSRLGGVLKSMPACGAALLLGAFAAAATPPFNAFTSEFAVVSAGFQAGHVGQAAMFLAIVGFVFAGTMFYTIRIVFGETSGPQPLPANGRTGVWTKIALVPPLAAVVATGLYVPSVLTDAVGQIVETFRGGGWS